MRHASNGLATGIFIAQLVNFWEIHSKKEQLEVYDGSGLVLMGSLASTLGAGFSVVQVIADNALTGRAQRLAQAWSSTGEASVYATLGKLHIGLGTFSFSTGAIAASIAAYQYSSKAMDALKKGDYAAMSGALIAGGGAAGSAIVNGAAVGKIGVALLDRLKRPDDLVRFWSSIGKDMSKYVGRLTLWDLGFWPFKLLVVDYTIILMLVHWISGS